MIYNRWEWPAAFDGVAHPMNARRGYLALLALLVLTALGDAARAQRIDLYDPPTCQPANAFISSSGGMGPLFGFYSQPSGTVTAQISSIDVAVALTGIAPGSLTGYLYGSSYFYFYGPVSETAGHFVFAIAPPLAASVVQQFTLYSWTLPALDPGDRLDITGVTLGLSDSTPVVDNTSDVTHIRPTGMLAQSITCRAGDNTSLWYQNADPVSTTTPVQLSDEGNQSKFLRLDLGSGLATTDRILLMVSTSQFNGVDCNDRASLNLATAIYLYNYSNGTANVVAASQQVLSPGASFATEALPADNGCAAWRGVLDLTALRSATGAGDPWLVRLLIDLNSDLATGPNPNQPVRTTIPKITEVSFVTSTTAHCTPRDAGWVDAARPDTARPDTTVRDALGTDTALRDSTLPDRAGQDLLGVDLAVPDTAQPVDAAGLPVIARAGPDQLVEVPASVVLDGTASRVPSGAVFTWTEKMTPAGAADSVVGSAGQTTVTIDQPGLWVYELRVEHAAVVSSDLVQIEARAPATTTGCDCQQLPGVNSLFTAVSIAFALFWRRRRSDSIY